MRPLLLSLGVFFFASLVFAQTVTTVPSPPVAGEPFRIEVSGDWRDSCVPRLTRLLINGREILLSFQISGGGCLAVVSPWSESIPVPPLDAGTYRVRARLVDFDGPLNFFQRTIEVSGTPTGVSITPSFDTHAGNRVVRIRGSFPGSNTPAVLFGNVPAEGVERVSATEIHATVPLQTNVGPVNVTVRGDGFNYVVPSGFTYVSIEEYEKVLIPIFTRQPIPGGFGSLWQTELRLLNTSNALIPGVDLLFPLDQEIPTGRVIEPDFAMPRNVDDPPAFVAYVRKEFSSSISFQLRVRDINRPTETWGTEIPVPRRDEMGFSFRLLDIPMRSGFRQTLRLYMPEYVACCSAQLRFYSADGELLADRTVRLTHPNGSIGGLVPTGYLREGSRELALQPAYAQLDLHTMPELQGEETVWLLATGSARRFWGFVSVTSDETQHVTTITPQ